MMIFRLSLVVSCLFFTLSGFAQKSAALHSQHQGNPVGINGSSQIFTADTLNFSVFEASTPSLYASPNSGYASGNNEYGDRAKAQAFVLDSSTVLVETLLWFGEKKISSGDPNSKVIVRLIRMDGTGTTTFGETQFGPGSTIDSADLLISNADTAQIMSVAFTPDLRLYDDFMISVDFSELAAGDTLALYSTLDGDALPQRSWEQWSDSTWHTMQQAWDLEIDFAMWPVVDWTTSGIDSPTFFQGLKLSQNTPNPSSGLTAIQYELAQFSDQVNFQIFDVNGKLVYQVSDRNKNAGQHSLNIDISHLSNGAYYYSINTNTGRLTKKMVLSK